MKDYNDIERALPGLKQEYRFGKLGASDLDGNPFEQFGRWLEEAVKAKVSKANAMVLSTVSSDAMPSSRILLLKGFSENGFLFFTNYSSPKSRDLEKNPHASILFFWPKLERQVRIFGQVKKISRQESAAYFRTRSDEAKLASWISHQSQVVESRQAIEMKLEEIRKKFHGKPIPLPSFWGGYRFIPETFEFWQGREHRLNDRFHYKKISQGWRIERLQP